MTLRRARARELGQYRPWLDRVAAKGEVFVRFWLGLGERATVMLEKEEERWEKRIPEQLRRFLGGGRSQYLINKHKKCDLLLIILHTLFLVFFVLCSVTQSKPNLS